jgi:glycosyltransferase involved in cell wall biosynthesis
VKQLSVDILLATCEGERFIEEQLGSILSQTYAPLRLIVRDDASQDKTPEILQSYAKRYPDKILFFSSRERSGVKLNFSKLMELSSAPYIMFSDQDDVWMPHKVEKTLEHMRLMEQQYGNHPFLVHTDLVVVDENLRDLHPSFWKYVRIKPIQDESLNRLLSQNVITGCTMMVNRLLLELAKPIPQETFMHDWWIALTAAAFGKIGVIQEPTIYYRQHGNNALGAQKFGSLGNLKNNFRKLMKHDVRKFQQAATFYHRYHDLFSARHRALVKAFIDLQRKSWTQKRVEIYRHGFFKQGLLRNVADFVLG